MACFNPRDAAEDMWDLYGEDAYRVAIEEVRAADKRGEHNLALQWREIAKACLLASDVTQFT